jgi:hypothetical protein
MAQQIGFLFDDVLASNPDERPDGSWNGAPTTALEVRAVLAKAQGVVGAVRGPFEPLFAQGVEKASEFYGNLSEDKHDSVFRQKIELDVDQVTAEEFSSACEKHSGKMVDGVRHKASSQHVQFLGNSNYAMYLPGVGTITLTVWPRQQAFQMTFAPWEERVMFSCFKDAMPAVQASYRLWSSKYAGPAIDCEKWQTNLPTFQIGDRRYISSCRMYSARGISTKGWTFVPEHQWSGPIRSYKEQIRAFDLGIVERGDLRGVAVLVGGARCVIDGVALIYDPDGAETEAQMRLERSNETDEADIEEHTL